MLQEAAAADLHDYFEFLVGEAREEFCAPADLPEPPALSLFAGGIIGQLDAKRLSAESRKMH